jgi:T6SS, Transcription factor, DNA binding domain
MLQPSFANDGVCVFAADPDRSYLDQTIFWAPEVLPTVIPVRPEPDEATDSHVGLDLSNLSEGQLRRGPDGWHAVLYLRGVEHRVWLKAASVVAVTYAVELPLDRDFELRADAGRRLWRGLNGRPQGHPLHALSPHRRRRLALALRALDARLDGATYREIAHVLLPNERISELHWRTHDLRNRIIRLAQTGFALMRGGYRALLRSPLRKK